MQRETTDGNQSIGNETDSHDLAGDSCSLYYEGLIGRGADVTVNSGLEYDGEGSRPVVDVHVGFGPGNFGFTVSAEEASELADRIEEESAAALDEASAQDL